MKMRDTSKFKGVCIVLINGTYWFLVSYSLRASESATAIPQSAFAVSISIYTNHLLPFIPITILTQPQLSIKGLRTRFPAQEILERLHLVLASPSLQDRVSVPSTLGGVHRISGEGGVEHVGAVDLGAEVAVVAGIVAAD